MPRRICETGRRNVPYLSAPALTASAVGVAAGAAVLAARWQLGLYLVAMLLPYAGMLGSGGDFSGVKLVVGVVLVATLIRLPINRDISRRAAGVLRDPLTVCMAALVAWSLLSALWAQFPGNALNESVTLLGDMVLFVLVALLRAPETVKLWRLYVWSAAFSVPVAVLLAVTGILSTPDGRLTLAGVNADAYSPLLLLAAWVCLAGLRFRIRLAKPVLVTTLLAGAVLTQTRTGLVAFAGGGLLALILAPRRARTLILRGAAALVLAAFLAGIAVFATAPSYAKRSLERYGTVAKVEARHSMSGRKSLWAGALRMWESAPVGGVGSGNYAQLSAKYSSYGKLVWSKRHHREAAHNMYLATLAELGLPGMAIFVSILLIVLVRVRRLASMLPFASGLLAAYCVYLIAGFALNWSYIKVPYVLAGSVMAIFLDLFRVDGEDRAIADIGSGPVA